MGPAEHTADAPQAKRHSCKRHITWLTRFNLVPFRFDSRHEAAFVRWFGFSEGWLRGVFGLVICYFLARLQLGMLQSGMLGLVGFSFAPGKASLLEPGLSWSIWLRYNGYYCTCTLHLLIDLQVGHSFGCAAGAEVLLCEHCWSQVAWRLSHDVTAIPRYYFAASAVASESDHMAAKALKTWLEGCPVPWHVCC